MSGGLKWQCNDLSVGPSVCPVHCGKTADRIRMPFGIIGRTGPGMRQVVGFGDRSTRRDTFGVNLGRAIITNGDFTASMCDSVSTVGAAVWGGVFGGSRHCCIRWGSTSSKGKGRFWGLFYFHNGECHWVADGEMFLIRMRKLDISVPQTYRWKARFVSFFVDYIRFQHQRRFFWEISKKVTIVLPKLKCKQQTVAARAAITAAEFMNARYAAVLHRPQPGQPAATRPCPQITLDRLVIITPTTDYL